ncbi:hypothetical protein [Brevundimonas sp. Marseille-Q4549]
MSAYIQDYTDWKRKLPDIGCMFAKLIATRPDRYGQQISIVLASTTPRRIARSIAAKIDAAIANPDVAAAVVLLPNVADLKMLAEAVVALGELPGWDVRTKALAHPTEGDLVAICASRMLNFGAGEIPSEALVLGPFEIFPKTRRAPVVGLEVFVGEPRQLDPKTEQPPSRANLAHMDVYLPTHDAFLRMWENSVQGRARSLDDPNDQRAKAKVSLVLPTGLADITVTEP